MIENKNMVRAYSRILYALLLYNNIFKGEKITMLLEEIKKKPNEELEDIFYDKWIMERMNSRDAIKSSDSKPELDSKIEFIKKCTLRYHMRVDNYDDLLKLAPKIREYLLKSEDDTDVFIIYTNRAGDCINIVTIMMNITRSLFLDTITMVKHCNFTNTRRVERFDFCNHDYINSEYVGSHNIKRLNHKCHEKMIEFIEYSGITDKTEIEISIERKNKKDFMELVYSDFYK